MHYPLGHGRSQMAERMPDEDQALDLSLRQSLAYHTLNRTWLDSMPLVFAEDEKQGLLRCKPTF